MLTAPKLAAALLALVMALAEPLAGRTQAPDRLVDIGGRRMHVRCLGQGSPAIILTAGMGDSSESWSPIEKRLASLSRVCAWDRAGLGQSDPSPFAQDVQHTTADLEALLRVARIPPPYLLVGHSIGSFESLMFAYRHREQVVAVVLIDPTSPFQNRRFAEASPAYASSITQRLQQRSARLRACAAGLQAGEPQPAACGEEMGSASIASRIARANAIVSLTESIDASSAQLTRAARSLRDMPLTVLTGGKRQPPSDALAAEMPKVSAAWSHMHDDLAARSSRGVNRIIPDSGHYIHHEQPDIVIAAVREALASGKTR